jgi:hypothetical protein
MRPDTKAALAELWEADFFSKLGQPVQAPGVIAVKSWQEAMALVTSRDWDNLRLEAENRLTEALHSQCRERYSKTWNKIAIEVNGLLAPLVKEKLRSLYRERALPKKFRQIIHGDTHAICMEAEYSDVVPAGWYTKHLKPWYLNGHLPCGWTGEFLREGELMVF